MSIPLGGPVACPRCHVMHTSVSKCPNVLNYLPGLDEVADAARAAFLEDLDAGVVR